MSLLQDLFSKRVIFVTGKGGTGKTLITSLLGKLAAAQGKRVLIAERSSCEQLPPLFGKSPVGHEETQIAPGLFAINLDPKACFREYIVKHLGFPRLYERVFSHKAVQSFLNAIPGIDDVMLLGRLYYTVEVQRSYDLVVFDSPSSGHFLNLVTVSQAILSSVLRGPLVNEVRKVHEFLRQSQNCTTLVVTNPEPLIVSETLELLTKLERSSCVSTGGVLINRNITPQSLSAIGIAPPELERYLAEVIARANTNQDAMQKEFVKAGFLSSLVFPELFGIKEPLAHNLELQLTEVPL